MRRVHPLSQSEIQQLTTGYKTGSHHDFRTRCKIVLLSDENMSAKQISIVLNKDVRTVYFTFNKYEIEGFKGLFNKEGQGRVSSLDKLSEKQISGLKKAVDNKPQNLNEVAAQLAEKFGFHISKRMLISYLKKTQIHMAQN